MNDQKMSKNIAYAIVILIVILGVGYYIYTDNIPVQDNIVGEEVVEGSEDETATEGDDVIIGEEDPLIGDIPAPDSKEEVIDIPDLNRPITFFIELPQQLKDIYRERIEKLTADLTLDSGAVGNWIDLGIQRKGIGDYEGARLIWEYVGVVSPLNNVSFFNLGDLYHFYLKDFKASEKNFLISKNNNESYIPVYRALYDLYTLSYRKETNAAEDILLEGLQNNPNNLDVLVLLGAYHKEKRNISQAAVYYEKARDEAERQGNQSMVDLLLEELENL